MRFIPRADIRHGTQLAAAVAISYIASAAIGLPEGFWAVMSALIVTRPDTGATLGAGWDRIRGTALGTACGLLGVWLRHTGVGAPTATLVIVAALAFASAGVPILRSAPITALIVLSSGGIAGHSAMQVAGLRVAEIAIGVSVGLAISVAVPAARAASRFDLECAKVLRKIANQVERALDVASRTEAERDAASAEIRAALRRLVMLGDSAAQESRLSIRSWMDRVGGNADGDATKRSSHSRMAKLVTRTSQDAGLLGRVFDARAVNAESNADAAWSELRVAACEGLIGVADALEKRCAQGRSDSIDVAASNARIYAPLASLRKVEAALGERRGARSMTDDSALMLAGPVRWLLDDLQSLARLAGLPRNKNDSIRSTRHPRL